MRIFKDHFWLLGVCAFLSLPLHASGQESSADGVTIDADSLTWFQWGGSSTDFILPESAQRNLLDWPQEGNPSILWKKEIGAGYSAIVTSGDSLYVPFRKDGNDHITALNSNDGETQWNRSWPVTLFEDMDQSFGKGPNSAPLLAESHLMFVSTDGHLRCLNAADGQTIWEHDLHEMFGRAKRKEEYGYSANLLRWNDWVIVPVGGELARVVAFRISNGEVVWKAGQGAVSYAPAILTQLQGQSQYLIFSPTELVSLDPESGTKLWSHPCVCVTENNLTSAVACDEDHVWIAGQLDAGTRVIRLVGQYDETKTEVVWENKRLTQAHWNSVVIDDLLFGCEGGNYESRFAAIEWKTGKVVWQVRGHTLAKPVRIGPTRLAWVSENGKFTMADVTKDGFERIGSFPLLGAKSWTPVTIEGNHVFARDQESIVAFDLPYADR